MGQLLADKPGFGGKALVVVTGIAILLSFIDSPRLRGQSDPRAATPLRFDVASVKLATQQQYISTIPDRSSGPHLHWTTQLWYLVQYAYNVPNWQISASASAPMGTIYEVDATMDPKTTDDQSRQMFQSLLADRFKMAIHHESKVMDGYSVTVAKSGLEIQEAKDGATPVWPDWLPQSAQCGKIAHEDWISTTVPAAGVSLVTGCRVTMQQLSNELQRVQQVPVVNQTGLTGDYYFAFEYLQQNAPVDADAPSLSEALKHLGLNLEKYRGPVDIIVVDHIGEPSPN